MERNEFDKLQRSDFDKQCSHLEDRIITDAEIVEGIQGPSIEVIEWKCGECGEVFTRV